ncbi:U6 snRNA phosphodiesterase-like [Haliotis rubra]|uniref:U6 snRNA phosphodiesterase-like n=1 Tax=Haliotis rubra TaxID=36100 RepID=UPI001EE58A55|nr:U6 snRNA phosphodiesterase-like [Haliotis rubra]
MLSVVEYSSSSDENDIHDSTEAILPPTVSDKRSASPSNDTSDCKRLKTVEPEIRREDQLLPLPSAIQKLYDDGTEKTRRVDNSKHCGRIRSFAHVEGNWATFVYVPVTPDDRLLELFTSLLSCLRPLKFQLMSDHHVTLSRTVVIRHHWIESLRDSLKENLSSCDGCICDIVQPRLYTNDEKTRTFLSLEVQEEGTHLRHYVDVVNKCFKEFRLQSYYENPSFHISIAWCLGDVTADVTDQKFRQMKKMVQVFGRENPDLSVLEVQEIECKSGNKVFRFPLQQDS